MKPCQHTQMGYLTLITLGGALLLILGLMLMNGFEWVALGTDGVM